MTISAQVIADSISPDKIRLTTLQLRYPRFIHSELMTHRVFSRNASSSRAVPVARLIEDILGDTAMPIHWGANQKGMQAEEECTNSIKVDRYSVAGNCAYSEFTHSEDAWLVARDNAIKAAKAFSEAGYHKQIVNRLLEPFSHINVLVSSTTWDNWFALRDHKDAMPEIEELAKQMRVALDGSEPVQRKPDDWHLPYASHYEVADYGLHNVIKASVARCARVSYVTHDFKRPKIEDDIKLYERLVGSVPLHASPAEHAATPDTMFYSSNGSWLHQEQHGNFTGWRQWRKILEREMELKEYKETLPHGYVVP